MQYKEYGKENCDVIILLHGGGLSWWNYRKMAERIQNEFRVIIAFLQANAVYSMKESLKNSNAAIHIFYGEKEARSIQVSAKKLHANLTNSSLHMLPDLYHGEFSLNHAEQYVKELLAIVKR